MFKPAIESASCYVLQASRNLKTIRNLVLQLRLFILCLQCTWSGNKVRELIAVKVLHTSLLNTAVVAFKVLPLGSYAQMTAPSPPFKTILELVLWYGLQSCRCIITDVIKVIKMPSFQYFLYHREQKKVIGGLSPQSCTNISLISFPLFPSLTKNLIVEELKTNLMSLIVFISLIFAQHVSNINMSIFRSLRLWWWITTSVILICKDRSFCN